MKIESRNIFATMKENVFMTFLVLMAILLSAAMAVSIVIFLANSARDQDYLRLVADLRVGVGQLTTESPVAVPTTTSSTNSTAAIGVL